MRQVLAEGKVFGPTKFSLIKSKMKKYKYAYIMIGLVAVYYGIFMYAPMYGALIAFKDYSPAQGFLKSPWAGMKHFTALFTSPSFFKLLRNTLMISFYDILFNFPAPIILALMLNEVSSRWFKGIVQTVSYLPRFISVVVICGIVKAFLMNDGMVNNVIFALSGEKLKFLQTAAYFRSIYIISEIWQTVGWNSIIFYAAITAVDPQLNEVCVIEGGGKLAQMRHVTLPCIMPTIMVMLILKIGSVLNVGFEKIILLYNPNTYETADVILSFVYRKGILEQNYSYATAVEIFNSVVNFILLIGANTLSKKINETGLW